jgi:hypothetical protein
MIAREFESASCRFTWTQGIARSLWLTLKIFVLWVVIALSSSLLGTLLGSCSDSIGVLGRLQPGSST